MLTSVRADFLVGSDGIHSVVRRHFYPDEGPPKFSQRILWRATTEAEPFLTGRSMVWAGHARQNSWPIRSCAGCRARGRSLVNWIAELRTPLDFTPPRTDWNKRVDKEVFREPFADWNFGWLDIPDLIDRADATSTSFRWSIATRCRAGRTAA